MLVREGVAGLVEEVGIQRAACIEGAEGVLDKRQLSPT